MKLKASKLRNRNESTSLLRDVVQYALPTDVYHEKIWPNLPVQSEFGEYNGVQVEGDTPMYVDDSFDIRKKLFDEIVPFNTPSYIPNFKSVNVNSIKQHYRPGDDVEIVGGGNGVTAVHSARIVGDDGSVTIYEADADRLADVERTVERNGVSDICNVRHAVVGNGYKIENESGASTVSVEDIGDVDAVELDCEGAEADIVPALGSLPDRLIVETHENKPWCPYRSIEAIREPMEDHGYDVAVKTGRWVDSLLVGRLR